MDSSRGHRQGASLLGEAETLALLHRINEDAMAIQDWRFCLDADGSALVRANFDGRDFASKLFAERIFPGANQFVDKCVMRVVGTSISKSALGKEGRFHLSPLPLARTYHTYLKPFVPKVSAE
jgi:hypothetical protein